MFSSTDLANMRSAQESHMMDLCNIQAYVETEDTYGELILTWPVDGSDISCGLNMKPGFERNNPDKTILQYDGTLRLPISTSLDVKDKIKITKRFGETLTTPLIYEIVSPIQRGSSGIRVLLKIVET